MAELIRGAEPSYADPSYSWPDYSIPSEYGRAWPKEITEKREFISEEREESFMDRIMEEDIEFLKVLKTLINSGYLD